MSRAAYAGASHVLEHDQAGRPSGLVRIGAAKERLAVRAHVAGCFERPERLFVRNGAPRITRLNGGRRERFERRPPFKKVIAGDVDKQRKSIQVMASRERLVALAKYRLDVFLGALLRMESHRVGIRPPNLALGSPKIRLRFVNPFAS